MYAKIKITGNIEVVTGMHIGGSDAFAAIGAIDSPVIKDPLSGLPVIPGSSLKGKMRTLLAKRYNEKVAAVPDEDAERILRLFGSSKNHKRGRLIFSDTVLSNNEELLDRGVASLTEAKFENTINRLTAVANPRQIERVIRGAEFPLDIIYEADEESEISEDFDTIHEGLKLLELDYIGGSGSRGYGKIKFHDISLEVVIGDADDSLIESCTARMADLV
jgi:CRISPR-associated protein Csm3